MLQEYLRIMLKAKSRPAVAKAAGITNAYLGQILKGTIPSREVLINLAKAIGAPAHALLKMANKPIEGALLLIRGLPGSGKSTMAKRIIATVAPEAKHFESDMYFMKDGVYRFDPSLLGSAHDWCVNQTALALALDKKVIVSNTFTRKREIVPYLIEAKRYKVPVHVIEAKGEYVNTHGVPMSTIESMAKRWEEVEYE